MGRARISKTLSFVMLAYVGLSYTSVARADPSVTVNNPTANSTYYVNATIIYSGTFQWTVNVDASIDSIGMYAVIGNGGDPSAGIIVSSNYASVTKQDGSGTFNSQNVTPSLTARSMAGSMFVTARPENASAGLFYLNPNHTPPAYFVPVSVTVTGE
jgi:hypothetical protein